MSAILQDLRYAARMLRKSPFFTWTAVVTMALGIGANVTIFTFADTLFFRPLPVKSPYQLVTVEAMRDGRWDWGYAYPAYAFFRDHSESFDDLAAHYSTAPLNVVVDGDSREANGAVVSANYFPMLGITPLLGRFFSPDEDSVPDRDSVAVISHRLWQTRFNGDPSILSRDIVVNGRPSTIIGVTPPDFQGVSVGFPNDIWIPTMMLRLGYRGCDGMTEFGCRPLTLLGRLAPGRTAAGAQAELNTLASRFGEIYPENKGRTVSVTSAVGMRQEGRQIFGYQIQLLMTVTGLLLLIACANVSGLLLVRATSRRKEIAVRLCLGAGRARLVRQLMTESVLLAMAGGVLGVLLSFWAKDLLLTFYTMSTGSHPRSYDLSPNPRVLAYSIGLAILTGVISGMAPAMGATRQDLAETLKDGGRSHSERHNRLRSVLVVSQVALSLSLLVAAGLLVRSSAQIRQGANFDQTNVALLGLRPALLNYSPEKAQSFTREVVRRLEGLPGVISVSLATRAGLAWLSQDEVSVRLPEQPQGRPEDELKVEYHEIAPRFFQTLRIPLTQGRDFDDGDRVGSPPVVIVNETMALRLWPRGSPLEQTVIVNQRPYRVVGVSKDAQFRSAADSPSPFLYLAVWQNPKQTDSRMVVRVASDPEAMLASLRREISEVDPKVPISEDMPMTRQVDAKFMPVLLTSSVASGSGALALFLSMIGLYSVLAFAVSQRTQEIGIRMALGAQPVDVLKLVVGQGMRLTVIGMALGLVAAFALSRFMASLLFGVSATDPATFAFVALLLGCVAWVACYLPARRATKVDPVVALRFE